MVKNKFEKLGFEVGKMKRDLEGRESEKRRGKNENNKWLGILGCFMKHYWAWIWFGLRFDPIQYRVHFSSKLDSVTSTFKKKYISIFNIKNHH